MNGTLKYICCVTAALLFTACSGPSENERTLEMNQWKEPNGKIKVLATTGMINDMVKAIGQEWIDSITLIKGELDPHSYNLVKGDDEKFHFAKLIFFNGLGLEHGQGLYHYLYENQKATNLGKAISERSPDDVIYFNQQPDPHIWMDVALFSKAIPYIVEALSQLDPTHADTYSANGKNLETRMLKTHAQMREVLDAIPTEQRYLVTSHDAFNYFAKAYFASPEEQKNGQWRQRIASPEGLAPDSQLSAADIQNILNYIQEHHVHVLFSESNVSKDSINKIITAGNEKGLSIRLVESALYADAMGPSGGPGDTYLKMMEHNASVIANNLLNK